MSSPIVFVSAGAVLPGALGVEAVWERLLLGQSAFGPPSPHRWNTAPYPELKKVLAGMVSDDSLEKIRRAKPGREDWLPGSLFCAGAADEIERALPEKTFLKFRSLAFILGTMGQDVEVSRCYFYDERESLEAVLGKDHPAVLAFFNDLFDRLPVEEQQSILSCTEAVQKTLGCALKSLVVDSACASSMTAIDVGRKLILSDEVEAALVGGMDSRIGPQNFLSFQRLGLLSSEGCYPFEAKACGIVPSEGAVLFLLTKEETAHKFHLPIMGYLDRVVGGSNGNETSLFAPSPSTGADVLRRAWNGETPDYVECHGTGTVLGDRIEIESLKKGIGEAVSFPMGSAKAVFGHTLGAAGAVGVLKALLILKHRIIPGSPYLRETLAPDFFRIPKETVSLGKVGPLKVGVSSSGFGGSVYHVILSSSPSTGAIPFEKEEIVEVGFDERPNDEIAKLCEIYDLKIPPASIGYVDPSQLSAIVVSQGALDRSLLYLEGISKDRVSVISAGHVVPARAEEVARRCYYEEFFHAYPETKSIAYGLQEEYAELNEEVSTAIMAAISGRIGMYFDLHGKTFHVDAGEDSGLAARAVANRELQSHESDLVILYTAVEKVASEVVHSRRKGASVKILCRRSYALDRQWPICGEATG